jgi:hypothetical protein
MLMHIFYKTRSQDGRVAASQEGHPGYASFRFFN